MGHDERNHTQEEEDAFASGQDNEHNRIKEFVDDKVLNAEMSQGRSKPTSHEYSWFAGYLAAYEEIQDTLNKP